MRRRSKTNATKTRSRKPAAIKRHRTPASRQHSGHRPDQSSDPLRRELDEAREQQAATADVLRIVSGSTGEVKPVFQAILNNAVRICEAKFGLLALYEGGLARAVATYNIPPAYAQRVAARSGPGFRPHPLSTIGRALSTKRVVHTLDYPVEVAGYKERDPTCVDVVELGGVRTLVSVPMLKQNTPIGAIQIFRQEVRPFTDRQIALVQNFAAQAVIAIENARLLSELRQRTTDLGEALEQQTATADVLRIISLSPGNLEPVFQAMLEKAVSICDAKFGTLFHFDGSAFHLAARVNTPAALAEFQKERGPFLPPSGSNLDRMMKTKQVQHSADDAAEPVPAQGLRLGGARSIVHVPMLQGEQLVGALVIYRQEVRPFSDKQVELLKNFAAQAVIAIENARLLSELRQSLEQQTATSEVLRVISSSPSDLTPVFQTMLASARRLCDATFGTLLLYEGNWRFRVVAMSNVPPGLAELRQREPVFEASPKTALGRTVGTKDVVHIVDLADEAIYKEQHHPAAVVLRELGGARTFLGVPMLGDTEVAGAIVIYRQQVRPFADKQIELVKNFAAQAVIAIENARLLGELRKRTSDLSEALEQQTATSDVLRVISSSPGTLEPVFQAMLENAVRICDAKFGIMWRYDNEAFDPVALFGAPEGLAEFVRQRGSFQPSPGTALDLILRTKDIVRISDAMTEPALGTARRGGARSLIIVPMLKDNALIGAITIYRQEVKPFTDKQVELIKNFAAQAVIAIENARLLKELRERTDQLEVQSREVVKLNQQLEQRVADQVGEIERMGRLRRFLPPQVADLIVASGTEKQLESHRREITALFCDLRGFTGFSESSDPEDVMALLRDYHAAIGQIIIKYGGTLERFAGDGVMVIFNDPVPVENPALQAVLMALDMRTAIGAMIEKWRTLGHDLGFGIGIAHGFATLGTIGFEGRFDYAAIGTVSNVASRLCDEAKPGQILISPRVRLAVNEAVTVEPVGEFTLKGIRRPMMTYNVLEGLSSKPN
jgi:GAF domain-containing protein